MKQVSPSKQQKLAQLRKQRLALIKILNTLEIPKNRAKVYEQLEQVEKEALEVYKLPDRENPFLIPKRPIRPENQIIEEPGSLLPFALAVVFILMMFTVLVDKFF